MKKQASDQSFHDRRYQERKRAEAAKKAAAEESCQGIGRARVLRRKKIRDGGGTRAFELRSNGQPRAAVPTWNLLGFPHKSFYATSLFLGIDLRLPVL